jgi:hypothetical protein
VAVLGGAGLLISLPGINIECSSTNGRTFGAYGEDPYLAGQIEPPRQLRAFQRVYLRPGQHAVVHFTLAKGE